MKHAKFSFVVVLLTTAELSMAAALAPAFREGNALKTINTGAQEAEPGLIPGQKYPCEIEMDAKMGVCAEGKSFAFYAQIR